MGQQTRGAYPVVSHPSITAVGRPLPFGGLSTRVLITTTTQAVRLYFRETDYDNDVNYWEVPSTSTFDQPIELPSMWIKSPGGTAVVHLMVQHRKG